MLSILFSNFNGLYLPFNISSSFNALILIPRELEAYILCRRKVIQMYIRIWIGNINKNSWCILSAFSEFCPWKGQETISKPMATNNPNVQILIFRNHFATKKEGKKKNRGPWKWGWFHIWHQICTGWVWNMK